MFKRYKKDKKWYHTSMTIKDYAEDITKMAPIRVYYNDVLLWDEDTDPLDWYKEILTKEILITRITFVITDFHHTEVYLYTR